jgi:hypothetical protein
LLYLSYVPSDEPEVQEEQFASSTEVARLSQAFFEDQRYNESYAQVVSLYSSD